ncbi:conserved hypothetical protein [Hymenobacter roseosalivarius DSM 11622]|uniref:DUF6884 domain-containing protein n=1 Tax=Hymenobacter roseosalivarius DSM 11622 TaxID=645990 RepID=A0A1W1VMS8_9BACT|nr:DUF6884 domain-containing protein [Hymenobacter roseosalivarius]SMB94593.1 conserved hypothetical protein [Hymenobacter roseosalivarius DSM 11622]
MKKTIVLISCASQKLKHKAEAQDLYISQIFRASLAYAKSLNPDKIFILSAKYHLLKLDNVIEHYNTTLSKIPENKRKDGLIVLNSDQKTEWGIHVLKQLSEHTNLSNDEFIFLAGQEYIKPLKNSIENFKNPLEGLKPGQRLKHLKNCLI